MEAARSAREPWPPAAAAALLGALAVGCAAAVGGPGPPSAEGAPSAEPSSARNGADAAAPEPERVGGEAAAPDRAVPAEPVVGAVLPLSGSPSNREYARLFLEGAEVAAALARRDGTPAELVVADNRGTPSGSARGVEEAVSRGAFVVLGPISDRNAESAAAAAPRGVAFISPAAGRAAGTIREVFSTGAGDPGAGSALAGAAAGLGHLDAVVVHPASPAETVEAEAFSESFAALGGLVRRAVRYEPGTTTFDELEEVESLRPGLLVVAAPPADLELLAPQISFFGLDTLGIQVAGTAAWTAPSLIESVARRHTHAVIAVSTSPPDAGLDPAADFVAAYEQHFRRTLRSPVPAVGFDLFRMAVAVHAEAHRSRSDAVAAVERLRGFEGATGRYSFDGGRLVRDYFPVRICDGALRPLTAPEADPSGVPEVPGADPARDPGADAPPPSPCP